MKKSKTKTIAGHVVAGLLLLAFLGAGGTKLAGMEPHPEQFEGWGYPVWFMYLTGLIEVSAAVLVAIPRTRLYGALGLIGVMLGAIGTHLIHAEFGALVGPIVLISLAGVEVWLTRSRSDVSQEGSVPTAQTA